MDAVSGVASVLTLLQIATVVAKTATSLYQRFSDVPAEVTAIVAHLLMVQVELEQIERLKGEAIHYNIPLHARLSLHTTLTTASKIIQALLEESKRIPQGDGLRARCKWILLDHRVVTKHLNDLRNVEITLGVFVQTFSL